ncbi:MULTISPECIES: hypothetical protein [unclassified Acidithiobacillus]|uniref:hypothetical protein n=1 Tax=unclassified Acidithiobacillus TaxID=2614800 RepID=UPI001D0D29DD|nr:MULTISPECIES: hypothetical protein [unclassified Acidithiobacillus]
MPKLNIVILLTISGCFSSMAWAAHTVGPSPEALWKEVQILQKTHAIMTGSVSYQAGSRTVDP